MCVSVCKGDTDLDSEELHAHQQTDDTLSSHVCVSVCKGDTDLDSEELHAHQQTDDALRSELRLFT